jgi:hypothetical protein
MKAAMPHVMVRESPAQSCFRVPGSALGNFMRAAFTSP